MNPIVWWILAVALLLFLLIVGVERRRRARAQRLQEQRRVASPAPAVAPPERLVELALKKREEELSARPRVVEVGAPAPAPVNPLRVKLEDPPPLAEVAPEPDTPVRQVTKMAMQQWDHVEVKGAAKTPAPAPRPPKTEDLDAAPAPPATKKPARPLDIDWGDVEVRKDGRK